MAKDTEKKVPIALPQFFNISFRTSLDGFKAYFVLNDTEVLGVASGTEEQRMKLAEEQPHVFKK